VFMSGTMFCVSMTILLLDLIAANLFYMPERPFYRGYPRALQARLRIIPRLNGNSSLLGKETVPFGRVWRKQQFSKAPISTSTGGQKSMIRFLSSISIGSPERPDT
jgi:hypothetical protein